MQFRSVKRSDFTSGARAVAREMDQVFRANRDSAIDFSMLAKESIKGRSQERRAAMDAEAAVAQAGVRAFGDVKETKDTINAAEDARAALRPAKRMAGFVGALGTLSGYALMAKNAKEDKKWREEREAREIKRDRLNAERWKSLLNQESFKHEPRPTPAPPKLLPIPKGSNESTTPAPESSDNTAPSSSGTQNMSAPVDLSKLSKSDYEHLAYAITSEAGGGNDKFGVAASILNRVAHHKFPGTVKDVIFADGQYEGVYQGKSTWSPEITQELMSPEGQKQLMNAFSVLDGRTDFKGQTQLHNRSNKGNKDYDGDGIPDMDPMFHPSGNLYHYYYQ